MSTVNTPAEQRVIFNVSWNTYLALASESDRPEKRIAYDQGVIEIMSPGLRHECAASLISRMIDVFTEEMNIPIQTSGSTTFKRDDLKRGFEADASYYIEHAECILGKHEIDLSIDPPPDLVVEVDISRTSLDKSAIYGSIGVPEIWRYDGEAISLYVHVGGERFCSTEASTVLPGFPIKEASHVLGRRQDDSETGLIRAFRTDLRHNTLYRTTT